MADCKKGIASTMGWNTFAQTIAYIVITQKKSMKNYVKKMKVTGHSGFNLGRVNCVIHRL